MLELGRICVDIGLKWVINSVGQSFNSLIKWKLNSAVHRELDMCLTRKTILRLFTKISRYLQTIGSFKGNLETCQ